MGSCDNIDSNAGFGKRIENIGGASAFFRQFLARKNYFASFRNHFGPEFGMGLFQVSDRFENIFQLVCLGSKCDGD